MTMSFKLTMSFKMSVFCFVSYFICTLFFTKAEHEFEDSTSDSANSCREDITCYEEELHDEDSCCTEEFCCEVYNAADYSGNESCSSVCLDEEVCCPQNMCCFEKETAPLAVKIVVYVIFAIGCIFSILKYFKRRNRTDPDTGAVTNDAAFNPQQQQQQQAFGSSLQNDYGYGQPAPPAMSSFGQNPDNNTGSSNYGGQQGGGGMFAASPRY